MPARIPLDNRSSSIPDSEPERVAIRLKAAQSSRLPSNMQVIEVSDSEPELNTPSNAGSRSPSPPIPRAQSIFEGDAYLPSPSKDLQSPKSNADSDNDVSPPRARALQLAQFAFSRAKDGPTASSSRSSTSTSPDILPVPEVPKKKTAPGRAKKAALELSVMVTEKDIEKVLKCIACDVAWTVRKSAVQKIQHMRTCCKKAAFTQETIDILLQDAIEAASNASTSKAKKATACDEPPPTAPTLLNDFVPPEAKKKRGRAAAAKTTVTSVLDSRNEILHRAQAIFQQDPAVFDESQTEGHPSAQRLGSSKFGGAKRTKTLFPHDEPPEPTQRFGASKLGAAKRTTTSLFATDDTPPPATQVFGPSRLGAAKPKKSLFAADDDSISDIDSNSDGPGPSRSKKSGPKARHSPKLGSIDVEDTGLSSAMATISLEDKGPRPARTPSPRSRSPRKTKPEKVKSSRSKVVYDAEWEDQVRQKILGDKDLHLRILRLEPIHLDMFCALVCDSKSSAKPSPKLITHLKAFLDKEGIMYYTLNKWGK